MSSDALHQPEPAFDHPRAQDVDGDPLPTASLDVPPPRPRSSEPFPQQIDDYRIVRRLGAGGMGVVFEAEQSNPRRLVALKIINAGVASREAMRRFQHEAQVLGRLQHVGIAQIYEAGMFDQGEGGRPFFAMELVRGRPITEHAAARELSLRQRLELLAKVCDAVQHAHLKGIIHRDLKPGNILVGGDGQPKVLDFGVARATDSDVRATTLQTQADQLIGTLPYMSPEQALGDSHDLDVRSDVYALGVIGFELLTGRLPYQVDRRTVFEAVRVIREEEPTSLSSIDRSLRGDVETIISKALEKDRTRRYQSAAELAADIRRFLSDEPIIARPASMSYRMRKFARRHKAMVFGVAAVVVALIGGVIVSTSFALTAQRQRHNALVQADKAQAISQFHRGMLSRANPAFAQGRDVTVREVLDQAASEVGSSFAGQPTLEAAIRGTIGESYSALSEIAASYEQFERAADIWMQQLGPDHPDTLSARTNVAVALHDLGRLDESIALHRDVLRRRQATLGPDHADTLASEVNLAMALKDVEAHDEAQRLLRSVIDRGAEFLGEGNRTVITAMGSLASLLKALGRYEEAAAAFEQTIDVARRFLGEDDHDTLANTDNYAGLLLMTGNHEQALGIYRDLYDRHIRVFGPTHAATLICANNFAIALQNAGDLTQAEQLFRTVVEQGRTRFGDTHPDVLVAMRNLAVLLYVRGELAAAESMLKDAVEVQIRRLGESHSETISTMATLGLVLAMQDRNDEAEPWHRRAYDATRRVLGAEHPESLSMAAEFAAFLRDVGRYEEADQLFREALAGLRRVLGDDAEPTLVAMYQYLGLLQKQERWQDALPLTEEFHRRAVAFAPSSAFGMMSPMRVARTMIGVGRYNEAETLLHESLRRLDAVAGANPQWRRSVIESFIDLYTKWNRPDEAAKWSERLEARSEIQDES